MKKDTRNYGKFHPRFAEGGVVDYDPDPNSPERAGGGGLVKAGPEHSENMWPRVFKDEYKKADEISPPSKTKDINAVESDNFMGWRVHHKPYEQEDT